MGKTLKRIQRIETEQGVVWEKDPEPPLEKTFFYSRHGLQELQV